MGLQVSMNKHSGRIVELPGGVLHKEKELCIGGMELLMGGPESFPEGHCARTDPKYKQFFIDLEERYGEEFPYVAPSPIGCDCPF